MNIKIYESSEKEAKEIIAEIDKEINE